jgi:hypothetical protein
VKVVAWCGFLTLVRIERPRFMLEDGLDNGRAESISNIAAIETHDWYILSFAAGVGDRPAVF